MKLSFPFQSDACLGALAPLALCVLAACETTSGPKARPTRVTEPVASHSIVEGNLTAVNPLDVVVLPVENRVGRSDLPLDLLRQSMARELIRLRYSPLSFGYVDARIEDGPIGNVITAEVAYTPGELNEQATLVLVLTGWDDSQWNSHARIDVTANVNLVDALRPGESLWGGPITTTVDLNHRRGAFATENALKRAACEELVGVILQHLPPRRPEIATP